MGFFNARNPDLGKDNAIGINFIIHLLVKNYLSAYLKPMLCLVSPSWKLCCNRGNTWNKALPRV